MQDDRVAVARVRRPGRVRVVECGHVSMECYECRRVRNVLAVLQCPVPPAQHAPLVNAVGDPGVNGGAAANCCGHNRACGSNVRPQQHGDAEVQERGRRGAVA